MAHIYSITTSDFNCKWVWKQACRRRPSPAEAVEGKGSLTDWISHKAVYRAGLLITDSSNCPILDRRLSPYFIFLCDTSLNLPGFWNCVEWNLLTNANKGICLYLLTEFFSLTKSFKNKKKNILKKYYTKKVETYMNLLNVTNDIYKFYIWAENSSPRRTPDILL